MFGLGSAMVSSSLETGLPAGLTWEGAVLNGRRPQEKLGPQDATACSKILPRYAELAV